MAHFIANYFNRSARHANACGVAHVLGDYYVTRCHREYDDWLDRARMDTYLDFEGVADEAAVEFGADDHKAAGVDVLWLTVRVVDLL